LHYRAKHTPNGNSVFREPNLMSELSLITKKIKKCRLCVDEPIGKPLPHEPRPVFQVSKDAKIAICGQAPGTLVHASGRPFTDPSGERLRRWTGLDESVFYDPKKVSVIPMGFCFPGQTPTGADLPPRRECAPKWRNQLFAELPQFRLVLLVGSYAIKWHLSGDKKRSLTDIVGDWRSYFDTNNDPAYAPMPHPSWRNNHWLKKNPWFEEEYMPVLRTEIERVLAL